MGDYGQELILDLHDCVTTRFTEEGIKQFTADLCELIGMERCELYTWGYDTPDERLMAPAHLAGRSCRCSQG